MINAVSRLTAAARMSRRQLTDGPSSQSKRTRRTLSHADSVTGPVPAGRVRPEVPRVRVIHQFESIMPSSVDPPAPAPAAVGESAPAPGCADDDEPILFDAHAGELAAFTDDLAEAVADGSGLTVDQPRKRTRKHEGQRCG